MDIDDGMRAMRCCGAALAGAMCDEGGGVEGSRRLAGRMADIFLCESHARMLRLRRESLLRSSRLS